MLLYILLGVVVAVGIAVWLGTSDGDTVASVSALAAFVSFLLLLGFGLASREENVESTYASSVTTMTNHSGVKGFAFIDGNNLVFKTNDGVRTVPYGNTHIAERGVGVGQVLITEHRDTYGWILPWSTKGDTTIVLHVPRGGLGVM